MSLELTMVCSEELDSSYDKFYIGFFYDNLETQVRYCAVILKFAVYHVY